MNCTDFKKKASDIVNITNEAEKNRYQKISRKELQRAGVNIRNITTDKEVKQAWRKFNKYQADWEKYCRKSKHFERNLLKGSFVDYSHLAYNGVTDDF